MGWLMVIRWLHASDAGSGMAIVHTCGLIQPTRSSKMATTSATLPLQGGPTIQFLDPNVIVGAEFRA
jgi:hypothetical protein